MVLFQIWAGSFYLANKILFAFAETQTSGQKRKLRIYGWVVYILGVPPWLVILIAERNWIAASVEAGGLPAMFFGLFNAYKNIDTPSKCMDQTTSVCTYAALVLGLSYSLWDKQGLTSASQLLELSAMTGFLLGSYFLAKQDFRGWLFFVLMNTSMAALLFIQDKLILSIQQMLSLCFVIFGFVSALRISRQQSIG